MHRLPFTPSVTKSLHPFHLLHVDLWGPTPTMSTNGFRYYLVLVDDFTKFCWVYLLKTSQTFSPYFNSSKAPLQLNSIFSLKFLDPIVGESSPHNHLKPSMLIMALSISYHVPTLLSKME